MAQSGVTFALPFCRNQPIRRMSRVWHQPSQVGKAYDWFQWWNCLGSSEPVSDHPGVTVATLCWVFGTQQSMVFSCLFWFVTTVVTLPIFIEWGKFFLFYHTIEYFLYLWVFCCFQISVFYFWFCPDLFKSIFIVHTVLRQVFWTILSFFCKIL